MKKGSTVSILALLLLAASVLLELVLLLLPVIHPQLMPSPVLWLSVHIVLALLAALAASYLLAARTQLKQAGRHPVAILKELVLPVEDAGEKPALALFYLVLLLCLSLPLVGALGASVALIIGNHQARVRHREAVYWQFTDNAELPFTAPLGRSSAAIDSRSLTEQVHFSGDSTGLYKKVLAAGRIRTALSVDTLKSAIRHPDERIRLTAYQTLDRKTSQLNLAISRLESQAASCQGQEQSNTWLHIASNYWELLTLEKDEPVAREQLLDKAANAAQSAVRIAPDNRNAHFLLGRISLLQRKPEQATQAFAEAARLGMPREKVLPYMAEAAFDKRDFSSASRLLKSIDPAFTVYPPLSHVASYWS